MPIYEGTSQIQALMAMKDTLLAITRAPQEFIKRVAQTRWRALSATDALERRVARLQLLSLAAQQHLVTRPFAAKVKGGAALRRWQGGPRRCSTRCSASGIPRRDFSLAMLHAERLTRLLADEQIAEVLLEQAEQAPTTRRSLLERYLERAEPRARFLHAEITTHRRAPAGEAEAGWAVRPGGRRPPATTADGASAARAEAAE